MKRGSHVTKTKTDKENYTRAIKSLENDTTVDDSLSFSTSDKSDKDLPIEYTKRGRPEDLTEKLGRHFQRYWVHWVISVAAAGGSFLVLNLNRDVGKLEGRVESFERGLRDNSDAIRDLNKKIDGKFDDQQKEIFELQKLGLRLQFRK